MSPVPTNSHFGIMGVEGPEIRSDRDASRCVVGKTTVAEYDPSGLSASTPGAKLDAGKLQPWLCIGGFSRALAEVANVTTKGAAKYSRNGWMHVDNGVERYMEAFGRHMLKLGAGEIVDADTGAYHKAAMIWNLLASLELELRENGKETQDHKS